MLTYTILMIQNIKLLYADFDEININILTLRANSPLGYAVNQVETGLSVTDL